MTRVMPGMEADMLDMVRVGTERPNILVDRMLYMQGMVGGMPRKWIVMIRMMC